MDKEFICRTCLKSNPPQICKKISEHEKNSRILEMLSYSIPELNMYLVVDPVICNNCINLLETTFKFKTECLKNEERLLKYRYGTRVSKVNLKSFFNSVGYNEPRTINNNYYKDVEVSRSVHELQIKPTKELKLPSSDQDGGFSSKPLFKCKKCKGCQFKLLSASMHLKVNVSPYTCLNCGKIFDQITELRKHMLAHVKPRKCKVCDKSFRDLHMLRKHLWSHTGAKLFACHLCPKKFQQKHCLKQHVQKHQGCDNVTCKICKKIFSTKYNMKIHMRSAHRRKEGCDLCGQTFYNKPDLVHHLQTESETCGKCFKEKRYPETTEEEKKPIINQTTVKVEPLFVDVNEDHTNIKEEPTEDHIVVTEPGFAVSNNNIRLLYAEDENDPEPSDTEIDVLN